MPVHLRVRPAIVLPYLTVSNSWYLDLTTHEVLACNTSLSSSPSSLSSYGVIRKGFLLSLVHRNYPSH